MFGAMFKICKEIHMGKALPIKQLGIEIHLPTVTLSGGWPAKKLSCPKYCKKGGRSSLNTMPPGFGKVEFTDDMIIYCRGFSGCHSPTIFLKDLVSRWEKWVGCNHRYGGLPQVLHTSKMVQYHLEGDILKYEANLRYSSGSLLLQSNFTRYNSFRRTICTGTRHQTVTCSYFINIMS